jgi:IS1 family transposase
MKSLPRSTRRQKGLAAHGLRGFERRFWQLNLEIFRNILLFGGFLDIQKPMPRARLSTEKQVYILAALAEGTPVNAVCRMFKTGKHAVLRLVRETGCALADYMDRNFRDLPCQRIEMDEQWQYVGCHGQRMAQREQERGDFWLWACIDPDTKLVLSHRIGTRRNIAGTWFVEDVASRIVGPVQISTDKNRSYLCNIRGAFHGREYSYGTDHKNFDDRDWQPDSQRKNWVAPIVSSEREAMIGEPDLSTVTTSHIERFFLSVRQECTRFTRLTLGYSKDMEFHKAAVALHIGLYNLVRKHTALGTTPAVAAGVEERKWILEDVVAMTQAYWEPRSAREKAEKAVAQRIADDKAFARAFKLAGI